MYIYVIYIKRTYTKNLGTEYVLKTFNLHQIKVEIL